MREMTCREFVDLVDDYLEHALDEDSIRLFVDHLAACAPCEVYLQQLLDTIALLRVSAASDTVLAQDDPRIIHVIDQLCQ